MKPIRVTMPARFEGYENRAAVQRGPIVYCLEAQDVEGPTSLEAWGPGWELAPVYIPENAEFTAEHRTEFLGGVTVLRGQLKQVSDDPGSAEDSGQTVGVTLVPYGVWGNRTAGAMRVWLGARAAPTFDFLWGLDKSEV
jgi:DUF1680 family protein